MTCCWDEIVDAGDSLVDMAGDALNEGLDYIEEAATAIKDEAENFVENFEESFDDFTEWLEETGEDFIDWAENTWNEMVKYGNDFAKSVFDALSEIADRLEEGFNDLVESASDALSSLADLALAALEWVGDLVTRAADWFLNEAVPFLWAVAKIGAALGLILLVVTNLWMLPFVLLAPMICTWIARDYGDEYGSVVENIINDNPRYREMHEIQRIPSNDRYVITSDLHRYASGNLDTLGIQETQKLYQGVLEYYGRTRNYHLIENGDIEDYWLRGGSGYGVVYDISSALPAPAFDNAFVEAGIANATQTHFNQIVMNNTASYAAINSMFHSQGRYHRTMGNHDDVYSDESMVETLQMVYPGLPVADYLVFITPQGNPVGLVCHGHQTDSWNRPACSYLGKVVTSLVSAVRDISFGYLSPGVPKPEDSTALLNQNSNNEMSSVSKWFGINTGLGSLDEVQLFDAFYKEWGSGQVDYSLDSGPYLLLGHTHTPLDRPGDPRNYTSWDRYFNSGTAIFHRMITCLEWDGRTNPSNPEIKVVAWTYNEAKPNSQIIRTELERGFLLPQSGRPSPDEDIILIPDLNNQITFDPVLW